MFDKYIYQGLHIIMRYAGRLNSWALREHVKILRREQNVQHEKLLREQENRDYLEELKKKL